MKARPPITSQNNQLELTLQECSNLQICSWDTNTFSESFLKFKVCTSPIFPIKSYKSVYLKSGPLKIINAYIFAHLVLWTYIFIEVTKKTATNMRSM